MALKLNKKLIDLESYKVDTEVYKIRLDANESFINPVDKLKDELADAFKALDFNRYPDNSYLELRKAIGAYCNVSPKLVVVGNGSDELLSIIIGNFLKADDTMLLAEPDFAMYKIFLSAYEKKGYSVQRAKGGAPDISEMIKLAHEKNVSAILLSNPSAFYSTVAAKENLLRLTDEVNCLVIVDEAYMDFSDQSLLGEVAKRDNLMVLKTCSKAFGCAGIRLGYAVASEKLIGIMDAIRPPYNLNILTEAAGKVIFSRPQHISDSIQKIIENRDVLYGRLKALEKSPKIDTVYPTATNFICIDTAHADEIYERLKQKSISVRNLKTMLRITVGTQVENDSFVEALSDIIL
ncbi:MAG TPA: histidinol-phosphate transaminase [Anaerovoracaceae bacterium]|nr:histidinol-phosphate transaminase [Anaerovoracaceae bacterium]